MDITKIADLLKATIDPNQREAAEQQLDAVHKIIGFAPALLQTVMNNAVDNPVRQAAAIYLKNDICRNWEVCEPKHGQPEEYSIHEQDKGQIRDVIVDACAHAPEMLRVHIGTCINIIVKNDFPHKWTGIIDQIFIYLRMERTTWPGALVAYYQLVKNFEYKCNTDRAPLDEAMKMLLPITQEKIVQLLPDMSNESLLLQKQILKIIYAFVQYQFPLKLMTRDLFMQWMEIMKRIVESPIPDHIDRLEVEERCEEPAWKLKKWALHFLTRVFDRYGSPGNVQKEYKDFATYYIKTYSEGIITAILKILEREGNKQYVSGRVLQQTLNYLTTAVNHACTWKILKVHMNLIVQNILFPLLCYTDDDQELWESDPQEYIRLKFDVFEDYVSPVTAAQTLLHASCKKRKNMLENTLQFVVQVMNNPSSEPRMKDGALHMVGSVADILLKKETYKDQIEPMLAAYVFPQFESSHGYLRARACWVLHYFADTKFQQDQNLYAALTLTQKCLLEEKELPVKVEAAVCLQSLLTSQDRIQKALEPNVTQIALELIKVIRDTENEDLTNVMQKLICLYHEKLVPVALEITQNLAMVFNQLMRDDEDNEDKSLTAMGLLNAIDAILTMMDDQREVIAQIEPIVVHLIVSVFESEQIDLYEEVLNLVCTVTTAAISPDLWKVFEVMYKVFNKDGFDYFTEMMPALHNYVTVDPEAFLSKPDHMIALFNMCKTVLTNPDSSDDHECHAAKLLEVIILQFRGRIDGFVHPILEIIVVRLTQEVKTEDLRTMLLQVVIASLFYNPQLLLEILDKLQPPNSNQSLFAHFVNQWMNDTHLFQGLHDRKVSVLGLITLMNMPINQRPQIVNEVANQILPSALLLFEGLKMAYQQKANADNQSESGDEEEDDDDDDSDPEDLEDDEDHVPATIEGIEEDELSDSDTDSYDEDYEQTALESYVTPLDDEDCPIDEYCEFKTTLEQLQATDPNWFNVLMAPLNAQQQKMLQDVFTLANQRRSAAESRKIEKSGGYTFANPAVPTSFNFGGKPIG